MKMQTLYYIQCADTREIVSSYKDYSHTRYWRELSGRLRDERGACEICGDTTELNVHHTTYENIGDEDESLLQVVCWDCHKTLHATGAEKCCNSGAFPESKSDSFKVVRRDKWPSMLEPRTPDTGGTKVFAQITYKWMAWATGYTYERVQRDRRAYNLDFSKPDDIAFYIISSKALPEQQK